MVMDCLRSCYQSYMRLYPEHPEILTLGRWRWCPDGAKALPFAHAFGSVTGDPWQWGSEYQLGEVYGLAGGTKGLSNARYRGRNYCGPVALWQEGSPLALMGTPPVDVEGVPRCCETARAELGGVVANGNGTFSSWADVALWWRPEELAGAPLGVPFSLVPHVPYTPRDGVPGFSGRVIVDAITGWRGVRYEQFSGAVSNYLTVPTPILADADFTAWAVCRPLAGIPVGAAIVASAGAADELRLQLQPTGLEARWTDQGFLLSDGVAPVLDQLEVISWRRRGSEWQLWRAGVQVAAATGPTSPTALLHSVTQAIGAVGSVCWVPEVIVFTRAVSSAEDAAWWNYLGLKYGSILTESGERILTESGQPILIEGS